MELFSSSLLRRREMVGKVNFHTDSIEEERKKPHDGFYELTAHLLKLPVDGIISDILSRLYIEDILRYRLVSKHLYKLIKEPSFIHLQLQRSQQSQQGIILQDSECRWLYRLTLEDTKNFGRYVACKEIKIPEFFGKKFALKQIENREFVGGSFAFVKASCNGLLCMSFSYNSYDPIVVYNPIIGHSITLPNSEECKSYVSVAGSTFDFNYISSVGLGFGFDSVNNKYKVVRVYNIHSNLSMFWTKGEIITLGESSWRPLEFPDKVADFANDIRMLVSLERYDGFNQVSPLFSNGAFHWVMHREDSSMPCRLLVLDIADEKFQTVELPYSEELPDRIRLFNVGESMALIEVREKIIHFFSIWRLIGSKNTGYMLDEDTFDISDLLRQAGTFSLMFKGMCGNNFVFEARDVIAFFDPQRKEGFLPDAFGVPQHFSTIPFAPSLVSPSSFSC